MKEIIVDYQKNNKLGFGPYSQTKSSVPPKILLMNWLFEKWTR